jgi:DNA-binding response OmpR family regulator
VTGAVLIVEDEAGVREFGTRALRRHGYTVFEADCGEAALSMLERYHGPVHLLVTDVGLPGMDGHELATRARRLRPDLPILFTTGHLDRAPAEHAPAASDRLEKPFSTRALLTRARALLDTPAAGRP